MRFRERARRLRDEVSWSLDLQDRTSTLRHATDVVLARSMRYWTPRARRERTIRCSEGLKLAYTLNRGDLQSIREVLIDECYRLPAAITPESIVDLGANIGLTSVYYGSLYDAKVVAVEPDPVNATMVERNLSRNSIAGEIINAAVGWPERRAHFVRSSYSNLGRIDELGAPVDVVSMHSILRRFPSSSVDLVKCDIEGGEGELFAGEIDWLDRVGTLIMEIHPDRVDPAAVIDRITSRGFRYVPADSLWPGSMDLFTRVALAPR